MPNRNAFDEREKYDHSGHSTQRRQEGDLKAPGAAPSRATTRGKDKPRTSQPAPRSR